MKGYKFVTADVADIVAAGSVQITPAEEFRRTSDKAGARGDANELTSRAAIKDGEETVHSDNRAFGADQFVMIVRGKRVPFQMTAVGESTAVIEDALLYCLSLENTPDIRQRMRKDFHADAVFEIADADEFAGILSQVPELSFRQMTKGEVVYSALETAASVAELSPVDALQKDIQFSWQKEFRLIWGADILQTRIIVQVPELARLLKRLA